MIIVKGGKIKEFDSPDWIVNVFVKKFYMFENQKYISDIETALKRWKSLIYQNLDLYWQLVTKISFWKAKSGYYCLKNFAFFENYYIFQIKTSISGQI